MQTEEAAALTGERQEVGERGKWAAQGAQRGRDRVAR